MKRVMKQREGQFFAVARQEYAALVGGKNYVAAMLISVFEYWTTMSIKDGWVFRTREQLAADTCIPGVSLWQIDTAVKLLMDHGFIERRGNPDKTVDRTYQYRLNPEAIDAAIDAALEATSTESTLPEATSTEYDMQPALSTTPTSTECNMQCGLSATPTSTECRNNTEDPQRTEERPSEAASRMTGTPKYSEVSGDFSRAREDGQVSSGPLDAAAVQESSPRRERKERPRKREREPEPEFSPDEIIRQYGLDREAA